MSFEEIRVVCVVYVSALAPLMYLIYKRDTLPTSVLSLYACIFISCAFGWELWFTFGWIDGDPVDIRRSAALNIWLPQNINGLMRGIKSFQNIDEQQQILHFNESRDCLQELKEVTFLY